MTVRSRREDEFERFVRERRTSLVRLATSLAAGDAYLAEDLVQSALTRVYLRGASRVGGTGAMFAYTRRALVNGLIDHKRRPVTRREWTTEELPDTPAPTVPTVADGRSDLLEALGRLPVGMRAAVVLRHVEGLSVDEAATALGCSTGTIKSQTARGLDRLRGLLSEDDEESQPAAAVTISEGALRCRT